MPNLSEQALRKQIKEGIFLPCYLFYGAESYLARLSAKQLARKVTPEGARGFNFTRLEGDDVSVADIEAAALAAPVMADKRMVVAQGIAVGKMDKKQLARLQSLVTKLPDSTVLLLLFTDPEVHPRSVPKLKTLAAACAAVGGVVEFTLKQPAEIVKQLAAYARKQNCELSSQLGYRLVEQCGRALEPLFIIVDQLCAYTGAGEILPQTVDLLVIPSIEHSSFDLARAILRGKREEALCILHRLFQEQTEPLMILGALNLSFIDLYRAKCVQAEGGTAADVTDRFAYRGKEFRIRNAMRDAARYSVSDLRRCVCLLSDADLACKTTHADARIVLEKAVVNMLPERPV